MSRRQIVFAIVSGIAMWIAYAGWLFSRNFGFVNAADRDDIAAVRAGLERGIPADTKGAEGMTALKYAAVKGNPEMVRLLLAYGADPTGGICQAVGRGRSKVTGILLRAGAHATWEQEATALYTAAEVDDYPTALLILKRGINPNAASPSGASNLTPLMYAAQNGSLPLFHALIGCGADISPRSIDGKTALMYATESATVDRRPICQYLISHNVNVNAKDDEGNTALLYILHSPIADDDTLAITQMLLRNGADPKARNNRGETPLEYAKRYRHPREAKLLEQSLH